MQPGGFAGPDFVFTYGAVFLYIILFAYWKIKGLVQGTQQGFGIPASRMDFTTGLDEIEAETIAAEEKRAAEPSVLREISRRVKGLRG